MAIVRDPDVRTASETYTDFVHERPVLGGFKLAIANDGTDSPYCYTDLDHKNCEWRLLSNL
jgi:hypothetical protein